jgi:hypothetical protein
MKADLSYDGLVGPLEEWHAHPVRWKVYLRVESEPWRWVDLEVPAGCSLLEHLGETYLRKVLLDQAIRGETI